MGQAVRERLSRRASFYSRWPRTPPRLGAQRWLLETPDLYRTARLATSACPTPVHEHARGHAPELSPLRQLLLALPPPRRHCGPVGRVSAGAVLSASAGPSALVLRSCTPCLARSGGVPGGRRCARRWGHSGSTTRRQRALRQRQLAIPSRCHRIAARAKSRVAAAIAHDPADLLALDIAVDAGHP